MLLMYGISFLIISTLEASSGNSRRAIEPAKVMMHKNVSLPMRGIVNERRQFFEQQALQRRNKSSLVASKNQDVIARERSQSLVAPNNSLVTKTQEGILVKRPLVRAESQQLPRPVIQSPKPKISPLTNKTVLLGSEKDQPLVSQKPIINLENHLDNVSKKLEELRKIEGIQDRQSKIKEVSDTYETYKKNKPEKDLSAQTDAEKIVDLEMQLRKFELSNEDLAKKTEELQKLKEAFENIELDMKSKNIADIAGDLHKDLMALNMEHEQKLYQAGIDKSDVNSILFINPVLQDKNIKKINNKKLDDIFEQLLVFSDSAELSPSYGHSALITNIKYKDPDYIESLSQFKKTLLDNPTFTKIAFDRNLKLFSRDELLTMIDRLINPDPHILFMDNASAIKNKKLSILQRIKKFFTRKDPRQVQLQKNFNDTIKKLDKTFNFPPKDVTQTVFGTKKNESLVQLIIDAQDVNSAVNLLSNQSDAVSIPSQLQELNAQLKNTKSFNYLTDQNSLKIIPKEILSETIDEVVHLLKNKLSKQLTSL